MIVGLTSGGQLVYAGEARFDIDNTNVDIFMDDGNQAEWIQRMDEAARLDGMGA